MSSDTAKYDFEKRFGTLKPVLTSTRGFWDSALGILHVVPSDELSYGLFPAVIVRRARVAWRQGVAPVAVARQSLSGRAGGDCSEESVTCDWVLLPDSPG